MRDFYYRENKNDPPFGPLSWYHADRGARRLSLDKTKSGLAEVLTVVGARKGDPPQPELKFSVVNMYIRGNRVLGGHKAQFHSNNELPPVK